LVLETSHSLGSILKTERERRGLSLQEVFEATRITTQNLAALEEDRFDYFPNKVYSRAFLRDYANYLGLDSSVLLTRYEDEWAKPVGSPKTPSPEQGKKSGSKTWAVILVIVLLLAACAVGLYYWQATSGGATRTDDVAETRGAPSPPDQDAATLPSPPSVDGEDQTSSAPDEPSEQPETETNPPVTDKVVVEIKAIGQVWVRVYVDDNPKPVYMNIMPAGQTLQWSGLKKISVRVARANAAEIRLNGVAVPPLSTGEGPANGTFTMDDVKRVTSLDTSNGSSPNQAPNPGAQPR